MLQRAKWIIYVFLAVGILLLMIGAITALHTQNLLRDGVTTAGKVIRLDRGASQRSYFPVVQFQAGDEQITFKSRMGSNPAPFRVGEIVTVVYDPLDPQHASIKSFGQMWGLSVILGALGVVFAAIPSVTLIVGARRRKLNAWLRQFGQRVTTKFDRVEQNTKIRVNGAYPYRIFSQGQNPFTGQVESFCSKNLWMDPSPYLRDRSIDVLIDPNNPKRYWLDTGFLPWKSE